MIRAASPGVIVYMSYGFGPKAEVIERLDLLTRGARSKREFSKRMLRGIYYKLKILEDTKFWRAGTVTDQMAMTLMRKKATGRPRRVFGE